VQRGALFTLLAIPASIAIFAVIGGVFGIITGIAAIVVPYIAGWLYSKGAGARMTRAAGGPFVGITAVAVILGTFVGIIGGFYHSFTRVGGDGGILGSAFWTTVRTQLTDNLADNAFPIIVGVGLGIVGIVSVLRGRTLGSPTVGGGPGPVAQSNMPGALGGTQPTTGAQVTPPQAGPTTNQPSPGVILNGKPIEPDSKP
jgi:hypothetical protein